MDHLTFTFDISTLTALGVLLWKIFSWARKVDEKVDKVNASVVSFQGEVKNRNQEVDKKFDEVTASVKLLRHGIQERNEEVNKKFDGVTASVDSLPSKLKIVVEGTKKES